MQPKSRVLSIVLLSLLFGSCTLSQPPSDALSRGPWPTKGWGVSRPEDQGMDPVLLEQMLESAARENIHGVVVVRHGYIVAEGYWGPSSRDIPHEVYSCTKSVTSALFGIALSKGLLSTIDQAAADFLPQWQSAADLQKRIITLRHLLTLTSGIEWGEWERWNAFGPTLDNMSTRMYYSPDWVQFVLDQPMAGQPGQKFNYNSGAVHLLSAILNKAVGGDVQSFAARNLFAPMGIERPSWVTDPSGVPFGGSGLRLTARDMAKLGYLYLNGGVWDGKQLVPEDWVKQSTAKQASGYPEIGGYGYLWWLKDLSADARTYSSFFAMGFAGQYIYVVPDLDLVAVFTGWNPAQSGKPRVAEELMIHYVIRAAGE